MSTSCNAFRGVSRIWRDRHWPGALFWLLFRPAAFFGILINVVFFLTATWHVYPHFYGSDIVFIFCWLTLFISGPAGTGLPSIDEWFVQHALPEQQRIQYADVPAFFLGVNPAPAPVASPGPAGSNGGRQGAGNRRFSGKYAQIGNLCSILK